MGIKDSDSGPCLALGRCVMTRSLEILLQASLYSLGALPLNRQTQYEDQRTSNLGSLHTLSRIMNDGQGCVSSGYDFDPPEPCPFLSSFSKQRRITFPCLSCAKDFDGNRGVGSGRGVPTGICPVVAFAFARRAVRQSYRPP